MGEYRIKCIVHDKNEVITHVGISNEKYAVQKIVDWILSKKHSFYTEVKGVKARVYAKEHPTTRRWFLQSSADGVIFNNLDYLPKCQV